MELGYKVTKIHSALQYTKFTGLMKDYAQFFLKIKFENTQSYTQEECDKINEAHRAMGFKFEVKPENTQKNKGLRQVAKICLNSLWGKFGQRTTQGCYEYVEGWNHMLLQMTNPEINAQAWRIISWS